MPTTEHQGRGVCVRPLGDVLGAEVVGLGPGDPGAAVRDTLAEAFLEHHLLVVRAGPLEAQRQVQVTGWFGTPVDDLGEGRPWTVFSNRTQAGRTHQEFHADYSFTPDPARVISLHPLELPPHGATTSFVSGARAWRRLPDDLRRRVEGLAAVHAYTPSVRAGDDPVETVSTVHPVVRPHPVSGAPVLFVTKEATRRILGVTPSESGQLLEALFAVLYAEDNRYLHRWAPGDLVVWDNQALQHSKEASDIRQGPRTFQRVVCNRRPYADLVPGVAGVQRAWRDQPAPTA